MSLIKSSDAILQTTAPQAATPSQRLQGIIEPIPVIVHVLLTGVLPAILLQLRAIFSFLFSGQIFSPIHWVHFFLFSLLNPWHWRDLILGIAFPSVLAQADLNAKEYKELLFVNAAGVILEVGAGSGANLKYYDASKIDHLYLLEPSEHLHGPLRKSLAEASQPGKRSQGLADKTTLIPAGVQDFDMLKRNYITKETIDTLVCVQVLCSIPNPMSHIQTMVSYLKPGGKLILYEHVRSTNNTTFLIQQVWTPFWRFMADGCEMTRASGLWVQQAANWEKVELARPTSEHDGTVMPHDVGVYTKHR